MNNLNKKRVLLGVTGGIAAYKCCDLVRRLGESGAEVRVVMTNAATEFVTPLTFQALSGNPVHQSLLDESAEAAMGHIDLARWADVILIAPATANTMAKLAQGMADDLLSTIVLASKAPILIAPAMNQQMWRAAATQANVKQLQSLAFTILGPAIGSQACGDVGPGRMLEPEVLLASLNEHFSTGDLSGTRVLVTAGPTREAIDPVRYISNRSSGKMGYAVASAALAAGADVTLISGPSQLAIPKGLEYISVETAGQMHTEVMQHIESSDIFISTAAVADYSVSNVADEKIKKTESDLTLTLTKTPDILASVATRPNPPITIGFAAETEQLEQYAKTKLINKQLDMIAANLVGSDLAFDKDDNELHVYWKDGQQILPMADKNKIARQLIELIAEQLLDKRTECQHRKDTNVKNIH